MRLLTRLWRFLTSIQFGIVLIVILMLVMMYATRFEVSTSTRAMKHYIYEAFWFDAAVALFVLNIVVNTWRRRPYRFRHAGFLVVHVGVLLVVAGALVSRYVGVDGSLALAEGESSHEVLLPTNDLVIALGERREIHPTHFEIRPLSRPPRDLHAVKESPYWVRVDRYFPTGAPADTVLADPESGVPVVRIVIGESDAPARAAWLVAGDPARNVFRSEQTAVWLVTSAELAALRRSWRSANEEGAQAPREAGRLQLFWTDGEVEALAVPTAGGTLSTSRSGFAVRIERVFRSFVVTRNGHAEGSGDATNPAVQFRLLKPQGEEEEHLAFANFPDFRRSPPEGEEWVLDHAAWKPNPAALASAEALREIALEWTAGGGIVTHTSWDDPLDGTDFAIGETRPFAAGQVFLRVSEAVASGRLERTIRRVSDEIRNPVIHVSLLADAGGDTETSWLQRLTGGPELVPAAVAPNEAWVFLGEEHEFATPLGSLRVAYVQRTIPLAFEIRLDDFIEERYPGSAIPASYESHVTVKPDAGEPFSARIYMNHPLEIGGYSFFQASFQRLPEGEVSVLSVSRDPGQTVSFVGYCVVVLGLLLIFFFKPLLRRLDDRSARSRPTGART
jgi:hypothetical protein